MPWRDMMSVMGSKNRAETMTDSLEMVALYQIMSISLQGF